MAYIKSLPTLIINNTEILHLSDISHSIPGYFDKGPNSEGAFSRSHTMFYHSV